MDSLRADFGGGFAVQHPFGGFLRFAGRAFEFGVADAVAVRSRHRDEDALRRRRLGYVEYEQLGELVLDALVVGAKG